MDTLNQPEHILDVDDLGIAYNLDGARHEIAKGIAFSVVRGEFVAFVGPSGVGKTSLVRCLAGLQRPSSGEISLRGEAITAGPPEGVAFVSQDYSRSLLPWMRVDSNVSLPLRGKRLPKEQIASRVGAALDAVGLAGASRKYPWQLSGGMQQRVSIARALAYHPELLIMDEPFASVDAQTRDELEDLVVSLQHSTGVTIVLITHDIDSAVYMADRVFVLGGRPASIMREVRVGLGAERNQLTTKADPRFIETRGDVLRSVQEAQRALITVTDTSRFPAIRKGRSA